MQENIVITDDAITGTLKKLSAGDLVDYWGEGNFIALKFTLPEGVEPEEVQEEVYKEQHQRQLQVDYDVLEPLKAHRDIYGSS